MQNIISMLVKLNQIKFSVRIVEDGSTANYTLQ